MRVRVAVAAALAALVAAPLALGLDFGPPGKVTVGGQPATMALIDANDDGRFDLVTADASRSGVSLLRSRGDGAFLARIDFPSVRAARGLAVADVNGDGFDDVVAANVSGGTVSLLLGNGRTLVPGGRFPAGAAPQAVAADDLDGDGNLDLAVGNTGAGDLHVSVLFGNGDGTFGAPVGYRTPTGTYSVAVVDVDSDGVPDIVSTDSFANTLSFLLGAGDGTFQEARQSEPVGPRPRWVTTGPVGLYVATADGVYAVSLEGPATRFLVGGPSAWVGVDDLDQDGYEDILAALPGSSRFSVLSGQAGELSTLKVGRSPSAAAVADFNEDGAPDLAVANRGSSTVSVFLNDGHIPPPGSSCVVPRLAGKALPAARTALRDAACTIGRVSRRYSRVRRGRVMAQRPRAGTRLPAGASVSVVLSRGPRR